MILERQKLIDNNIDIQNKQKIESELYIKEINKIANKIISDAKIRANEIKDSSDKAILDTMNKIKDKEVIINDANKALNERIEKVNTLMSANDELISKIKNEKDELYKQESELID
jgi:hypothetical protein